jgi:hypothetical protein
LRSVELFYRDMILLFVKEDDIVGYFYNFIGV